ncbi:P83/100 family protein, partial [Iningainema tapete]|uniref:P83/100 family protein n=1 Tax=Iningainema tapete TaxID=2806730 RepID=UPI001EE2303C
MADASIYTVGGTVQTNRSGVYIQRRADEELLALCRERKFAYVLTPRQMGKSSLMVRTARQLRTEEIQSVMIDLTGIGTQVINPEQWYLGLLMQIEAQLMLDTDVHQWWQAHAHLGFTQRLTEFFQQVLLVEITASVVIFIDEIDTTLSLDFTDDFYAAIRYLYVSRAFRAEFERLSFVLFGVATPGDLIRDPKRTPFNIGQRVDLTDFTFNEAKPLAEGLGLATSQAEQVLQWVLSWTKGHPYLTQRLFSIISQQSQKNWTKADINNIVSSTFFGAMSEQDNNLQFVRDMLTKRAPDKAAVLSIYREIRRGRAVADEEQSIIKSHLKLSGIVKRENAVLKMRNPIYQQVFDLKWVNQHLPLNLRDFWERYKPLLPYLAGGLIFSVLMSALALYAIEQRQEAVNQRQEALRQQQEAENQAKNAQTQQNLAQKRAEEAQAAQKRAEASQQAEVKQRQLAQQRQSQIADALKETEAAQQAETKQRQLAQQRQLQIADALEKTKAAQQAETKQRQLAEQALQKTQTAQKLAVQRQKEAQRQRDVAQQRQKEANNAKAEAKKGQVNAEILAQSLTSENLFVSNLNFEALIGSLKLAKRVKTPGKNIEPGNRMRAVATLQQIVYGIRERNRLEGHSSIVNSVAFSPDGKTIASGSRDNTVKLWNLQGEQLKT